MKNRRRESENEYRSLFENMSNAFALHEMIFDSLGKPIDYRYVDVNPAFEELTGLKAESLIDKTAKEVLPNIEDYWIKRYGAVVVTGEQAAFQNYSPELNRHYDVLVYKTNTNHFAAIFTDITERKKIEMEKEISFQLLHLINSSNDLHEFMKYSVGLFKKFTNCEAVGIRLKEEEDFPYFETEGFPEDFIRKENSLCAKDNKGNILRQSNGEPILECMCGNILQGRINPKFSFFTEHGSFWSNGTSELLASTSDEDRQTHTRNYCNKRGYESVALIPLKAGGETFGLLQFNDHRKGMYSKEKIEFLERLADYFALGLAKKKGDKLLSDSKEKYKNLFESLQQGVFYRKADGTISDINKAALEMLGLTREEFLNGTFVNREWNVIDSKGVALKPKEYPSMTALISGKPIVDQEIGIFDVKTNAYRWFVVNVHLEFRIGEDSPYRAAVTLHEITEHKLAEKALRESEEKFRSLFNNSEVGMFRTRLDGSEILEFNEKYLKILNYTREEVLGKYSENMWADKSERDKMVKLLKANGYVTDFECELLNKQGEIRKCLTSLKLYPDKQILEGSIQDVTERKQAEEALKASEEILRVSEEKYRSIFDNSPIAVEFYDGGGNYMDANKAALDMFGVDSIETMRDFNFFNSPHVFPTIKEKCRNGIPVRYEKWIDFEDVKKDKIYTTNRSDKLYLDTSVIPIVVEGTKEPKAYIVQIQDITERKETDDFFRMLYNLALKLGQTFDLQKVLKLLLSSVIEVSGMTSGGIYIVDRNTGALNLEMYEGFSERFISEAKYFGPDSENTKLVMAGKNVYAKHSDLPSEYNRLFEGLKAVAVLPILHQNKVIASINLASNKSDEIIHIKRKRIELIAAQLGGFIARVLLHDELKKNKEQISNAAKIANLGHWEYDVETDTFTVNDLFYYLFHTTTKEEGGYTILFTDFMKRFIAPENSSFVSSEIIKAIHTPYPQYIRQIEHKFIYSDGNIGYFAVRFYIQKDSNGKTIKIFGANQDITKRKLVEEEVMSQKNLLSSIFESSPYIIALVDKNLGVVAINKEGEKYAGRDKEALLDHLEGDVFNCINSFVNGGCGKNPDCHSCPIKETVNSTVKTMKPNLDVEGKMIFVINGAPQEFNLLISATPVKQKNSNYVLLTIVDITLRKKTEEAVLKSEKRLLKAQRIAHVGNWEINLKTKTMWASEESLRIYGFDLSKSEFPLEDSQNVVVDEDRPRLEEALEKLISKGEGYNEEYAIERPNDGLIRQVHSVAELIYNSDGEKTAVYGVIQDITDRMNILEELKESEEKYRSLVELSPDAILIYQNENIVYLNSAALRLFGASKWSELIGTSYIERIHPDFRSIVNKRKEMLSISNPIDMPMEEKIIRLDGSFIDVEAGASYFIYKGKPAIQIMARDITERKNFLTALQESEERFRTLIENAPDGIEVLDLEGNYLEVNSAGCKQIGFTREELSGMKVFDVDPGLTLKSYKEAVNKLKLGIPDHQEVIHKHKDGTLFPVEITTGLLKISGKETILAIVRDITERKKVERELDLYRNHLEELVNKRTNEIALINEKLIKEVEKEKEIEIILRDSLDKEKELNELKSRFISTASHEFKTPLTTILSSIELIQRYGKLWDDEKLDKHIKRVLTSVDHLSKLIDEVLTISRSESGKIQNNPENLDLMELCNNFIDEVKSEMTRSHKLIFKFNSTEKEFLLDPKLTRYIIVNLLTNAIKYSPKGGRIEFGVSVNEKNLCFTVRDEGIGFHPEDEKHLFEPFFRAANALDIEGTGLGLSIVKRTVEVMNGSIAFTSILGKGTTVEIKIPRS